MNCYKDYDSKLIQKSYCGKNYVKDSFLPILMNGHVKDGEVKSELGMVAEDKERYKIK